MKNRIIGFVLLWLVVIFGASECMGSGDVYTNFGQNMGTVSMPFTVFGTRSSSSDTHTFYFTSHSTGTYRLAIDPSFTANRVGMYVTVSAQMANGDYTLGTRTSDMPKSSCSISLTANRKYKVVISGGAFSENYSYYFSIGRSGQQVTFDANGGSFPALIQSIGTSFNYTVDAMYGYLPTPMSPEGGTFRGWYTAPTGGTMVSAVSAVSMGQSRLYAQYYFVPRFYYVAFHSNGGAGSMQKQVFQYGVAQAFTLNVFSKSGAIFKGWSTYPDGLVVYEDGDVVNNLTAIEYGTVNLYAVWGTPIKIAFDTQGGDIGLKIVNYCLGDSIGRFPIPSKVGYSLVGWYDAAVDGKVVTEATVVRENATYYAYWQANHYVIYYDSNGGTGAMDAQQMEYDVAAPLFGNGFTKPGSLFKGWAASANGNSMYRDVADVKNLSAIEGDVVTLYAVWQEKPDWVLDCESSLSGAGKVSLDGNDNIVVTLTNDVSGTVEIPDNVGAVTIDLNGYVMTGDEGPAIRIVKGDDEGVVTLEATKLAIVDTSDGESGRITGGGESAGIEIAEDAALRVRLDVEDDVGVFNGDGSEQDWRALSPVEFTLSAGEYFKATLAELGYDVPTDGTPYSVVAKGLPAGLKLMYNKAVTKKVKGKTVVVKAAKSEWWIEGVPTAAVDFFTNPPYLVITANGETTTDTLPVEVAAQEVVDLGELELGKAINTNGWLSGVGAGWTVSGLPTGLKYTPSVVYVNPKAKKKVVKYPAYSVYGKTTKAGLFTITAKKKKGAYYETMKYRVLVRPKTVDTVVFGESLTNITTMAYVPVEWDLTNDVASVGGKVAKVAGLPTGLTFAASNTYAYKNAKKKTGKYLKQYGQTIIGTPTKTGTYVVTFTKNVTTGTGKNKKTVAKTAQILWTVVANDAELELGFNTAGGVVESGVVGLKYDGLMAFTATSNATVTASGMPAGVKLANLDNGQYAFTGFTTKAGTYLVTVKATLNGKTVTQRVALEVEGLPTWAKGTFNGYVTGDVQGSDADEQQLVPPGGIYGLATITVSAVGKVSGKFHELGTNWTFSAASYTGYDETAPAYTVPVTAKYPYKVPEKVKSGKKTVTKMVTKYVTRTMTLTVGADALGGVATLAETDGSSVVAWQNRWDSTYKAVGTRLFTTKSGKKTLAYKTFTIKGTTEEGAAIGLMASETLSLKVTPNGAVAATLSFDTGKTKKDAKTKKTVKVIYKATCNTVVTPTSPADADPFTGEVYLYFAPSPANGFPGYVGVLPF